ncbi:autotransporter outer membrane beta-barrel domain-containing protein [Bradyrhizobium guangdongense]
MLFTGVCLSATGAQAQDATWLTNPGSGDFNTATNWTPAAVPTGTAFFNTSNATALSFAGDTTIGGLTFNPGASNYTFTNNHDLMFDGAGIVINGGSATINGGTLIFNIASSAGSATINGYTLFYGTSTAANATINGRGEFSGSSTAGNSTITINLGDVFLFSSSSTAGSSRILNNDSLVFKSTSAAGNAAITNSSSGTIQFQDSATAGHASITNAGAVVFGVDIGSGFTNSTAGSATINNSGSGSVVFSNTSSGANATITNNATPGAGRVVFQDSSTAGSAAITNNTGEIIFIDSSTAGNATIVNNAPLSLNGAVVFGGGSTADAATIITSAGAGTGFSGAATGGTARFITSANGLVDISGLASAGMTAGSIEGAGNYFLGAKELTVGGNNLSTTVSGVISDGRFDGDPAGGVGGSLVKVGAGTLTLSGANTYTGATTVNGGVLQVEGSIASSSLTTVNAGGALAGSGIVGNAVIASGGILLPGSGPAGSAMTIAGNLAFQSGALYLVTLNSNAASSVNVTGTAALGGAVGISVATGGTVAKQYTILSAAGGVSGTFTSLDGTGAPAGVAASLSYDSSHAYLNFALDYGTRTGLNANQSAVAATLQNFFDANGGINVAFAGRSASDLTQLSGESATGSQQTTFDAMSQFLGLLTDPFVTGRDGSTAGSSGAVPFTEENSSLASAARAGDARDAFARMPRKAAAAELASDRRWSVWAAGFGGSQTTSGNAALGSANTTSGIYGTAVGAGYRFSPDTIAGFALAGGGTSFSVNGLGWGRSDLFQAGAFARHTVGPAYLTAALAYGWQDVTTDRIVTATGVDHLRAEFNANAWSGRVESGYRFVAPWIGGVAITPYAAGQVTTFNLPNYAESVVSGADTFALTYAAKGVTDTRSELGLRGDKSFAIQDAMLTLRGRLAWAHDFSPDRSIGAVFQSLPGTAFVVNGARQASDSALTTATAEVKWSSGWSIGASFEGEFSNVTRSYAGKGAVRYAW